VQLFEVVVCLYQFVVGTLLQIRRNEEDTNISTIRSKHALTMHTFTTASSSIIVKT